MLDAEINKAGAGGRGERKRALVLSFSDLRTDPRVRRQLALLCGEFEVTAAGSGCPDDLPVRCLAIPAQHWSGPAKAVAALRLAAGRYESAYWSSRCVKAARNVPQGAGFDLVVANDIWTLPLALDLKGKAKVLFDAHEYAPLEFEESWKWRFFFQRYNEYLCRRYLPLADAATTVCEGIAEEYRRTLGVRMAIVQNAPPYQDL
ncbi:MAG TPA: glycosyltransferase, partial [Burkholderiales bacterium]|nr:glycosyltransferase [Burkholderiales bacterium]